MEMRYIILGMATIAMLLFYPATIHAQGSSISGGDLGSAINSTASFINMVNQSGYLIFYPNLTQAYSYLNLAKQDSQSNPGYSYLLLTRAKASAQAELNSIDQYRSDSLYILVIFAILLAILLYLLMMPRGAGKSVGRAK